VNLKRELVKKCLTNLLRHLITSVIFPATPVRFENVTREWKCRNLKDRRQSRETRQREGEAALVAPLVLGHGRAGL
jgi:hypothetical protein